MLISDDFPFSVNSEAQLYEAGLIGGKAIAIIPSFDSSALVQSGDVLRSKVKPGLTDLVNQRLTPLQEKIEKMMVSADQLLINLNEVFDVQSKENIKLSIAELSTTISSFKTTSESLNSLVEDNKPAIGETILNFSKISKDLSSVSESLSESDIDLIMLDLKSTISSFDLLLKNIENGDGSFGKFIKDDRLYVNLQGATKQLEELLNDMKLNPKRYVHFSLFGKKAQQYGVDGKKVKTTED